MLLLIIGLLVFFAIHLLPANEALRSNLVGKTGRGGYMAVFSLVSLAGLVLISIGYHQLQLDPANNALLWQAPSWSVHLAMAAMLVVGILFAASSIPSRIRNGVKHPMMIGVAIWASVHLVANGDLGSLLLFGGFLVYAVLSILSANARGARGPLGNKQPGSIVNDIAVIVIGAGLFYVFLKWGHPALIGVSILPS